MAGVRAARTEEEEEEVVRKDAREAGWGYHKGWLVGRNGHLRVAGATVEEGKASWVRRTWKDEQLWSGKEPCLHHHYFLLRFSSACCCYHPRGCPFLLPRLLFTASRFVLRPYGSIHQCTYTTQAAAQHKGSAGLAMQKTGLSIKCTAHYMGSGVENSKLGVIRYE